jgi:hypothetical protein
MARPIRINYASTGVKQWIPLNCNITPFEVSFETEGGTATVEATIDDVNDSSITPVATTVTSPLARPVTAIRCNLAAGTTIFKVLQSGIK